MNTFEKKEWDKKTEHFELDLFVTMNYIFIEVRITFLSPFAHEDVITVEAVIIWQTDTAYLYFKAVTILGRVIEDIFTWMCRTGVKASNSE